MGYPFKSYYNIFVWNKFLLKSNQKSNINENQWDSTIADIQRQSKKQPPGSVL